MANADLMLTVAEVAVTFAGFAGLVTVIAQRLSGADTTLATGRLQSMLVLSLLVVAFSFVPQVVAGFGLSDEAVGRASSGLYGLAWVGYNVYTVRVAAALRAAGAFPTGVALYINMVVHLISPLVLLAGAAGVWNSMTAQVYTLALFGMLYISGVIFVQVFVSLVRREASAATPPPEEPDPDALCAEVPS